MIFFDNEQRIIDENEAREKQITEALTRCGSIEWGTDFFDSNEFRKLLVDFIKIKKPHVYNFDLPARTTKVIREQANKLLIMQTEEIDRRVLYADNDERLIHDFEVEFGEKLDETNIDNFIKYVKKHTRKKEVTSLPILWNTSDSRNGFSSIYSFPSEDLEIIEKYPIISTGLTMHNQNDDLGSTVLVHEMVHALVDRHKGVVENLMHDELLSIYMELVAAYELDENLLDIAILSRLQGLKFNAMNTHQDVYEGLIPDANAKYIDSALYAFALLEQYKNASSTARIALRKEINKTLSGNRTLEETLKELNITEEEGSHIMRKEIKRVMK